MSKPLLVVKDLHKRFGNLEVLSGVSLEVHVGEVVVLIGSSGSGKSTLLRCINQIETPTSGTVIFDELPLFDNDVPRGGARAAVQKKVTKIGLVFQQFNLFPHMTALQNIIEAPVGVLGQPRKEAERRARELLAQVDLSDKTDNYPNTLSGGQQQRVAIIRALAMEPELIMFDEPTSALDTEMVGEVLAVMKDLAEKGMTMVIASHEMDFIRSVASRIAVLDRGIIVEEGPPSEILVRPHDERTKRLLKRVTH